MKLHAPTIVVLLLASTIVAPVSPAATDNEAPLVEAGLDQEVSRGTTVHLDATESRDPDGTIEQYTWSVQTPDGQAIAPDCLNCARTQFVPSEVGTYNVTVTVTDDDGASNNDTLYVDVSPGSGPQLTISGPAEPTVGDSVTYTASIEAGAADLSEVQWFVDGERVATHSVSGQTQTDTLDRTFPASDEHTISPTVYDEDGQRASDAFSIQPVSSDAGDETGKTPTLASQGSPTIHGPQKVLGTRPLRANYTVSLDVSTQNVEKVEWHTAEGFVGSGNAETMIWSPGDHNLFAVVTYTDDSTNVARFSDGTTSVVADPRPDVSIGDVTRHGEISGRATASDGYENVQSLTVFVDGEQVARTEVEETQLRKRNSGELVTSYSFEEITPEEPHIVRVVATDARGQSTERTRSVTPTGTPEIVRAEFVNGPVDSYHERINARRYAAHHVLEIDLNGVDPNELDYNTDSIMTDDLKNLDNSKYHVTQEQENGQLIIHSYWSGKSPGEYLTESAISVGEVHQSDVFRSAFTVSPSNPELRYEVISGGRVDYAPDWGLVIDAGESFDPDGTNLSYIWQYGAKPISPDNTTAKFDSWQAAQLTIEDEHELKTRNDENFLGYFNPGVNHTRELSAGPYKPNETVEFRIFSRSYKLSKNSYIVNLGLKLPHTSGTVSSWDEVKIDNGECESGPCDYRIQTAEQLDIDNRRYRYYVGTLELPANAFSNGTNEPKVVQFNSENPAETSTEFDLPNVNVLTKGSKYWKNVTITDLEYVIEEPDYEWKVVTNESALNGYLEDNFSVASTDARLTYVVEKKVKTQDAKFETRSKSFQQRGHLRAFLEENPEWRDAGSNTITRTYSTTETEWRNSRSGNGTYTGDTREKLVSPAEYKHERKYRYEYQVERTETETVTRTKYRQVQKTGTRTVTRCNRYIGCYEATETYTYWTEEPYTYTTTRTYTYYDTETNTYWSTGKRHHDHEYTGQSRQTKTESAVYKTQYEYQFEVDHTDTVYRFIAEKQVQTQPAEFEWKEHSETANKFAAQTMADRGSDWRIGKTRSTPEWTLKKHSGTQIYSAESFSETDHVVETSAKGVGTTVQSYLDTSTGETIEEPLGRESLEFSGEIALEADEIKKELGVPSSSNRGEDIDWCDLKQYC